LQLIANERDIAEKLLNGNNCGLTQGKQLYILSKYYYNTLPEKYHDEKGKETSLKNRVKENLHSYLREKSINNYIWEMKEPFLRKVVKDTEGSELIEVESVPIYSEEIELIRNIGNIDKEKFLFTMLSESKLKAKIRNKGEYWSNLDSNEICKLANIKKSKPIREKYINEFVNNELIKIVNRVDKIDRQLIFVGGNELLFEVNSFKDFGLQYEKFVLGNEKIKECEECGDLIYRKASADKYCMKCKQEKYLNRHIKYNKTRK